MKIEQSYDKVVLTNEEIQEALRKLVEVKTGRKVRGAVVVNHQQHKHSLMGGIADIITVSGAAFCYLEPVVLPATGGSMVE